MLLALSVGGATPTTALPRDAELEATKHTRYYKNKIPAVAYYLFVDALKRKILCEPGLCNEDERRRRRHRVCGWAE